MAGVRQISEGEITMPLTKSGSKVKKEMREQYGKKKGEEVFYASINANKKGSGKWHQKRSARKT